mmetsp:Transcript_62076/g.131128  ORF Transcript_62076/g.131128 Transcript_62076/m.131128 type:complete len:201 (+) Transcript_62076:431-1033(+)
MLSGNGWWARHSLRIRRILGVLRAVRGFFGGLLPILLGVLGVLAAVVAVVVVGVAVVAGVRGVLGCAQAEAGTETGVWRLGRARNCYWQHRRAGVATAAGGGGEGRRTGPLFTFEVFCYFGYDIKVYLLAFQKNNGPILIIQCCGQSRHSMNDVSFQALYPGRYDLHCFYALSHPPIFSVQGRAHVLGLLWRDKVHESKA